MIGSMLTPWIAPTPEASPEFRALIGDQVLGVELPTAFGAFFAAAQGNINHRWAHRSQYNDQIELNNAMAASRSFWAVYLIPLLALIGFIDELQSARRGRNRWTFRTLNTISPVLAAAIIYAAFELIYSEATGLQSNSSHAPSGDPILEWSWGLGVLALGMAVSLVGVFTSPSPVPVDGLSD
jgi:hypothetical protein